jgi:excisionase family DNA binding protein
LFFEAQPSWLLPEAQLRTVSPVLSTTQAAALASVTRHTVEREISRGNLRAVKVGRTWVIDPAEAERWAARFRPYAGLRKPEPAAPGGPA